MRAGLDLIRCSHQVRGSGQGRESFTGSSFVRSDTGGVILLGAQALNLQLVVGLQVSPQLRDACLDLRGLGHLFQALDLKRHVLGTAGVVQPKVHLARQGRRLDFFLRSGGFNGGRSNSRAHLPFGEQSALSPGRGGGGYGRPGSGLGRLGRLRTPGTSAKCQVHETLHDSARSAAVGCLLAQTFNQSLVRLVDAPGNQVLREARCGFLGSFLATSNHGPLDGLDPGSFGCRGDTRQDADRRKCLQCAGDGA